MSVEDDLRAEIAALTQDRDDLRARLAAVWDEAAEATADWMANNPSPSGVPRDPPRNPYDVAPPTEPIATDTDQDDGTYMRDHTGRVVDPFAQAIEDGAPPGDAAPSWTVADQAPSGEAQGGDLP